MKYLIISVLLVFSVAVNAQESSKKSRKELKAEKLTQQKETVKKLIENKSFVFDARTVFSATSGDVNISYPYNVKLNHDSIYSYLPYYGRAYTVDNELTESPMVFDLPIKEMKIVKNKKNGYQVDVKVIKGMDNISFSFNISETGNTTLVVISTNRQVITYYGDLELNIEEINEI